MNCEEFRNNNQSLGELCHGLDECCWYVIEVSSRLGNPPYLAMLYTGFKSSTGYRSIHILNDCFEPDRRTIARVVKRVGKFTFNGLE